MKYCESFYWNAASNIILTRKRNLTLYNAVVKFLISFLFLGGSLMSESHFVPELR